MTKCTDGSTHMFVPVGTPYFGSKPRVYKYGQEPTGMRGQKQHMVCAKCLAGTTVSTGHDHVSKAPYKTPSWLAT